LSLSLSLRLFVKLGPGLQVSGLQIKSIYSALKKFVDNL